MSYCRWSSDDFKCDLYIYESVYDCWTIHVAGSRYNVPPNHAPKLVLLDDDGNVASMGRPTDESWDAYAKWMEDATDPIDLPFAGETFHLASPGECADKVEELIALGYHVMPDVVATLRAEQEEMDEAEPDQAEA